MNHISLYLCRAVTALVLLCCALPADIMAQSAPGEVIEMKLGRKERKKAAREISGDYTQWNKAAMNGRFKCDKLPIAPSLKISMVRDKSLIISVRAPFIGEAARVEVDNETLLFVNKMKKCYTRLEMSGKEKMLSNVQSLLLGRVVIFGEGELSDSNCGKTEIYDLYDEQGELMGRGIVPDLPVEEISYGYTVDAGNKITGVILSALQSAIEVVTQGKGQSEEIAADEYVTLASADIEYDGDGNAEAQLKASYGKYRFDGVLEMNAPEFGAKLIDPFKLTDKYREVPLKEAIRF